MEGRGRAHSVGAFHIPRQACGRSEGAFQCRACGCFNACWWGSAQGTTGRRTPQRGTPGAPGCSLAATGKADERGGENPMPRLLGLWLRNGADHNGNPEGNLSVLRGERRKGSSHSPRLRQVPRLWGLRQSANRQPIDHLPQLWRARDQAARFSVASRAAFQLSCGSSSSGLGEWALMAPSASRK